MKIIKKLEKIAPPNPQVVLTIGYFDGVHLGHQTIIHRVVEIAQTNHQQSAVLTFSNHPSTILNPEHPTEDLYTCEQKIQLIEQLGIDLLIFLPFDVDIATMSAEEFLELLQETIPFSHLILGHDARLGHERKGDPTTIEQLAQEKGFYVEYLPPKKVDNQVVSSSLIRKSIAAGDLKTAAKLLGREC